MKNTNTREFRSKVFRYILDSIDSCEAEKLSDDRARAAYIWERFRVEHNYPDNKQRIPNLQARVADWLNGIALNIAFTNADIIETAESWHECRFTDSQCETVLAGWFRFMAFKLIQCVEAHGVDVSGEY